MLFSFLFCHETGKFFLQSLPCHLESQETMPAEMGRFTMHQAGRRTFMTILASMMICTLSENNVQAQEQVAVLVFAALSITNNVNTNLGFTTL